MLLGKKMGKNKNSILMNTCLIFQIQSNVYIVIIIINYHHYSYTAP